MKPQYTARNDLYDAMDELISHYKDDKYRLPWITLDSAQFKIFKDFNEPEGDDYFYKKILVRCLS